MTYNGIGTANIQVLTNYSKQIVVSDREISFKFLNLSQTIKVASINYTPVPADKAEFDVLINTNLVAELKDYYSKTLAPSIKEQVESLKIPKTFASNYTYQYNNYTVSYMMGLNSLQVISSGKTK